MKKVGLYIHIPFCKHKCSYCDFYSVVWEDGMIEKYLSALRKEISMIENFVKFPVSWLDISTIYIGGGTPSVLNSTEIKNLFDIITSEFNISNLQEVNFEVNPESFNEEKLSSLIENNLKISSEKLRLSIGVQSFSDKILSFAGRIHTYEDVVRVMKILTDRRIKNYNFDLIFGFPGQSLDDVANDLNIAVSFNPTHISYYALSIEEGTKFFLSGYSTEPDLQAEMYEFIVSKIATYNYRRYEISNFSFPGYECKHNLNYWRYGEYIGLGPSSVSFINFKRIKNVNNVYDYMNEKFLYEEEVIDEKTQLKEKIMLRLRTVDGVEMEDTFYNKYKFLIDDLINKQIFVLDNNKVRINDRYIFLSNSIIERFF